MTSRRPVLGDFLTAARRHLEQAATQSSTPAPGRDAEEITASLHRLIKALAGYAADLTTSFGGLSDRDLNLLSSFVRAALQARDALSSASAALGSPAMASPPIGVLARRLDAAGVTLIAGRDLLQTHFASGPDGWRRGRSNWAPVITSDPVARALLAEITALSRQAAAAGTAVLPGIRPGPAVEPGRRMQLACHWLEVAGGSGQRERVTDAERELLHAIPGSLLPPRRFPDGSELVPELCTGVITTSERVSHLAWAAARAAPGSPAISVTSWRRTATAGTATSHHCYLLLTALAAQHPRGGTAAIGDALEQAAAEARRSRAAWLRAGRALGDVTTDVRWRTSRIAAESADLALWTGRLAYASPSWLPSHGPNHPVRPPGDLAPAPADVSNIVAALHYTTEALERMAVSSEQQVRGAIRAHRILMPAKSLPDGADTFGQFVLAPKNRTTSLRESCHAATKASTRTVSMLAGIAGEVRASSRILTAAKIAARPAPFPASRRPAEEALAAAHDQAAPAPAGAPAGPVETSLRDLGVISPRLLWRASGVDRLASQVIAEATASRSNHELPAAGRATRKRGTRTPGRSVSPVSPAGRGGAGLPLRPAAAAQQEPEAAP